MKTFTATDIAEFVLRHYPAAKKWPKLDDWINWEMEHDFCFLVGDDDHQLRGVLFIRPVLDPIRAHFSQLYFDEEGDTMFIDLAVAQPPIRDVLQCLAFAVIRRFGIRAKFARRHPTKMPVVKSVKFHIVDRLLKEGVLHGT